VGTQIEEKKEITFMKHHRSMIPLLVLGVTSALSAYGHAASCSTPTNCTCGSASLPPDMVAAGYYYSPSPDLVAGSALIDVAPSDVTEPDQYYYKAQRGCCVVTLTIDGSTIYMDVNNLTWNGSPVQGATGDPRLGADCFSGA